MALREQVRTFILQNFILEKPEDLVDDESMLNKGIMDSTGVLELVAYIESTFEIRVEDDELSRDNLDSINDIVNYLERKLAISANPHGVERITAFQA
jgi:acyl carrier protein